jgi:hypothetical protein
LSWTFSWVSSTATTMSSISASDEIRTEKSLES